MLKKRALFRQLFVLFYVNMVLICYFCALVNYFYKGQNYMNLLKSVSIVLFLVITSLASAKTYYISTTGNDSNPGTFSRPWLTWHYAFNHTPSGDTCYFRGGIFRAYSTSIGASLYSSAHNGTYSHPTCFFNYPGEVPVLDCSRVATSPNQIGIGISKCSNIYFKGLTVKNVRQLPGGLPSYGWLLWNFGSAHDDAPNNIRLENCTAHNIGGTGFCAAGVDTIHYINCDTYIICDSLTSYDPGGAGTGFAIHEGGYSDGTKSYVYHYGCRAWQCSDQGFANLYPGVAVYDHCWAIKNGNFVYPGNIYQKGSGWKWGWYTEQKIKNPLVVQVTIHNCIAVDNEYRGFNGADDRGTKYELRAHFYNNFAYRNGKLHPEGNISGTGFYDNINADTVGRWDHWYRNNVSYNNTGHSDGPDGDYIPGAYYKSNNLFDVAGSPVTNAYFISLDTTGMCGPRQVDGSLPFTNFGKPRSGSPLVDAGIRTSGLPYIGSAPDIGWFESGSEASVKVIPVYVSSSIENSVPSRLEMTYNVVLANIVPNPSAFTIKINTITRTVSSVAVSGTKVLLDLASPVAYGDLVSIAYSKPATNPLQTSSGGHAVSFSAQTVTNRVLSINVPLLIYPNPARESVTLRLDGNKINADFIQITDLSGKVILKKEIDPDLKEFTIPLHLKNGIFLVHFISHELTKYTQKLIVSK